MAIDNPVYADFVAGGLAGSDVGSSSSALDWVTHGVPAMMDSAVASLWNSADYVAFKLGTKTQQLADAVTGNDTPLPKWLAPDLNQATAADVYKAIEGKAPSDAATSFVNQHQDGVNLGGFLLGSIVPGVAAVKGLTAVQGAKTAQLFRNGTLVSENAGASVGLLSNTAERYWLQRAGQAISSGESATKARFLAAAAGGGQFALEGVAFELGAYAALNQAPMYDNVKDLGDFTSHVASSAMIFGAAGGLLKFGGWSAREFINSAGEATTVGKIRDFTGEQLTKAALLTQQAGNLFGASAGKGRGAITSGDLIADLSRSVRTQVEPTGNAVLDARLAGLSRGRDTEVNTLLNTLYTKLAGGDAAAVRASLEKLGPEATQQVLTGAKQLTRATPEFVASSRAYLVDLAQGVTAEKAVLLAGDLGKAEWKAGVFTVDGAVWNLQKELSGEALLTGEVAKVNAAYYAADKLAADAVLTGAPRPTAVAIEALPQLEAQLKHFGELRITGASGKQATYTGNDATEALRQIKTAAMESLTKAGMPMEEIAARLNVKESFLTQAAVDQSAFIGATDATARRWMAVEYDIANAPNVWALHGAAVLDSKIAAAREGHKLVAASILKRALPEFEVADLKALEHRFAGFFSATNAQYGSVLEKASAIGRLRQKAMEELAMERGASLINAEQLLRNFGEKSAEAVAFNALATRVRGTGLKYHLEGGQLVTAQWKEALDAGTAGTLDAAEHIIPIKVAGVSEAGAGAIERWIEAHIQQDGKYLRQQNSVREAKGESRLVGTDTFYIPPPTLASRKHAAIVVGADGSKGMLFGKTPEELSAAILRTRTDFPTSTVLQRADTDAWFKAAGEYQAEAAYGASRMDTAMLRKGTMKPAEATNSFQTLDEVNAWYARKEYAITAGATELNYGQQLAEAALAARALNPAGDANAFTKLLDTMFGKTDQTTKWGIINKWAEGIGDNVMEATWGAYRQSRQGKGAIGQEASQAVAQGYGVNAYESQVLWEQAARKGWDGSALKAVKELNTLQRIGVLGLDYWNGVTNAIGTPILLLPEMKAAMAAGQSVPYMKLVGDAISNYFKRPELLNRYNSLGIVDKSLTAHRELVDAVGLISGAKTSKDVLQQAGVAQGKVAAFFDAMQTPTNWSERFTRFIGADVGRQIAELRGLTGAEVDAFAGNFANKVSGNFTAGQRPQVFQGILGNAVGLFQSYQFNYLQQVFRHLEEGSGKRVGMMMAMQGTVFGAQSLPGFAVANYHLLEKHNDEHSGIYSGLPKLVGEDVGNYVLYGTASNLLGANLWTRGDSNPRNITVLPVTPSDLATVSYFKKGAEALAGFGSSMLNGGSLKVSGLEAVAHAGINRPLAGVAEWALGARTSQKGQLDMPVSQDLLSIATAVRFLGAKPLDEAIKMETFYRFNKLKLADQEKLNTVGAAMRTQLLDQATGGDEVDIDGFMKSYSDAGGNPASFRKFYLSNMKNATTPRATNLANATRNSPWARNYQELLQPDSIPTLGAVGEQ